MDGIAYEYRQANHAVSHSYLKPVIDPLIASVPWGSTVLDLGCGNGSFLSLFRNRGWYLHGTDFSPSGIAVARQSFPDIEFTLADATAPSGDLLKRVGQFDLILSTEVIEHVYDPRGFIRTALELLRPGGLLVVTTPYHGYLKNLALALTGKMDAHFTVLWDHGHIKFWSVSTLTKALTEAGFREVHMAGSGRVPWLWKSMVLSARK